MSAGFGAATVAVYENSKPDYASAADIASGLNSGSHVVRNALVETGFELPLPQTKEGIIGVVNPIKVSPHEYVYLDANSQPGHVAVHQVHYAGALVLSPNNSSTEMAHDIKTPLALVYHDYPTVDDPNRPLQRYYSVVMGDRSGREDDMMTLRPGPNGQIDEGELAQAYGWFADDRAGDPVYFGK